MANQTVSEKDILGALGKVQEPELHKDLVTLNMIRDINIEGSNISFTVVLTTPACPLKSQIERQAREAVLAVEGVKAVHIKMDANVPADGRSRGLIGIAHPQCHSCRLGQRRGRENYGCCEYCRCACTEWCPGWVARCRYLRP